MILKSWGWGPLLFLTLQGPVGLEWFISNFSTEFEFSVEDISTNGLLEQLLCTVMGFQFYLPWDRKLKYWVVYLGMWGSIQVSCLG